EFKQIGLNFKQIPIQLVVASTGFLFGIMEYYILKPEPMIDNLSWQEIWLPALLFFVCIGFVEEFIFRGVIQHAALEVFGGRGLVYVSLIFAIMHIGYLSWIDVIFVFLVGLFFSWSVKKTGSLLGVIISHGITNTVLYLIVPFLLG
ncbi:MAG: CPBP family intramembrane metalloprotease, partial [Dehalococcoidales bacterium]|nr:CPBP family intramembrane metalloprotease [Dehalococcoidales bacterium]